MGRFVPDSVTTFGYAAEHGVESLLRFSGSDVNLTAVTASRQCASKQRGDRRWQRACVVRASGAILLSPASRTAVPAARRPGGLMPGKRDAYEELFVATYARTVQLARLLGADDPEDVAQEAFARLYIKLGRLDDPTAAGQYLRVSVLNEVRSRGRRKAVYRRHLPGLLVPASQGTPEAVEHRDEVAQLARSLDRLSARQREVIVLRYWMELSEREIATTLGISPGSVKQHASRAIGALRRDLEVE